MPSESDGSTAEPAFNPSANSDSHPSKPPASPEVTANPETTGKADSDLLEKFVYDDKIVRMFCTATLIWGLVGTLAGLLVAILLVVPKAAMGFDFLSFARLRPLHTNAAIFAFAGNAIFAAVYYSTQRLCK